MWSGAWRWGVIFPYTFADLPFTFSAASFPSGLSACCLHQVRICLCDKVMPVSSEEGFQIPFVQLVKSPVCMLSLQSEPGLLWGHLKGPGMGLT